MSIFPTIPVLSFFGSDSHWHLLMNFFHSFPCLVSVVTISRTYLFHWFPHLSTDIISLMWPVTSTPLNFMSTTSHVSIIWPFRSQGLPSLLFSYCCVQLLVTALFVLTFVFSCHKIGAAYKKVKDTLVLFALCFFFQEAIFAVTVLLFSHRRSNGFLFSTLLSVFNFCSILLQNKCCIKEARNT